MRTLKILLLLACITGPALSAHAQDIACDPATVELVGAVINVEPGSADTDSLQCALAEAVRLGVQKVRLAEGTYSIETAIQAENFVGQIEGRSRSGTIIEHSGESAFLFLRGSPSLRSMTIRSTRNSGDVLSVVFLGSADNCDQRVAFAEIDRVDFIAPGPRDAPQYAFYATNTFGCENPRLLGSLTVNRSSITGYNIGGLVAMGDAARVVIRTNQFDDVGACTLLAESNADFSFLGNTCLFGTVGVSSANSEDDVRRNNIRVRENRFTYNSIGREGFACAQLTNSTPASVSASVAANTCEISGSPVAATGIVLDGVEDSVVLGNSLRGATNGILVNSGTGVFINGNGFANTAPDYDIGIGGGASGTITQSGSALLIDQGAGTLLLP